MESLQQSKLLSSKSLPFNFRSIPEGCVYPDSSKEETMISETQGIEYPGIDSCLTISCIFKDNLKLGAHCVQIPNSLQYKPTQIVSNISATLSSKSYFLSKVFVLGSVSDGISLESSDWKPSTVSEGTFNHDSPTALGIFFAACFKCEKVFFKNLKGNIIVNADGNSIYIGESKEPLKEVDGERIGYDNFEKQDMGEDVLSSAYMSLEDLKNFFEFK